MSLSAAVAQGFLLGVSKSASKRSPLVFGYLHYWGDFASHLPVNQRVEVPQVTLVV
jgi:hypothetical protein